VSVILLIFNSFLISSLSERNSCPWYQKTFQVEVIWVVTCNVVVGYQRFRCQCQCCLHVPQHYTASQPRRPLLETSPPWKPQNSHQKMCLSSFGRPYITLLSRLLIHMTGHHFLLSGTFYSILNNYNSKAFVTVPFSVFIYCSVPFFTLLIATSTIIAMSLTETLKKKNNFVAHRLKVKVKLSLCLTKNDAMKTYISLNSARRHDCVWGEWRYSFTHS
jgi:hypothetical protein